MDHKKKLTLFEAACVVAGLGFGGSVMAVPYLASLNGIVPVISIMIIAYLISILLHLMVVEVVLRDDSPQQLIEIFGKYLFIKSWWGNILMWLVFTLIVVTFYALLAGYIIGSGELLVNILAIPLWTGKTMTYVVAAGVVFFGLKTIGLSEKYAIISIALVLVALSIGSFGKPFNQIPVFSGSLKTVLALYGMVMFCLSCLFSVPQAAEGLAWNKRLVSWSVLLGIGINLVFTIVVALMVMFVSHPVTEFAIIGWGRAVGKWALILGSTFALLALLTSYWSVSYALAVIFMERLNWGYRLAWLVATLPTFLMAISGFAGFLDFMRYAGGATAVLLAILVPPALKRCRQKSDGREPLFSLGFWGGAAFRYIVIGGYLLGAIGSVLPLK